MPRKPGLNSEFIMFDVVYEDGTQRSNRKVPRTLTGGLDGGDVNEHIRAAGVLNDEAVALLGVEELDGTLSHVALLWKTHHAFLRLREQFTQSKSGFCVVLGRALWEPGKSG
jgi:hypothetical protein